MIRGAAAVFVVRDIEASLTHYRDALGFAVAFRYGEPTFYAGLCRDELQLHLIAARATARPAGASALCVFVEDVDAFHAELVSRGAKIVKPPQNYDYGMRDFDVVDLDGNQLIFGTASKQKVEAQTTA